MMNDVFLPDYAKKYGCALADIRGQWLEYLKTHKLEPNALLKDEVHLNDHGNFLMAELVKRYLVYRPALFTDEEKSVVRTFKVGQEVNWQGNKLVFPFEGNRVDLIGGKAAPGGATGTKEVAQILIDGKKPSEWPCHYMIPRVSNSQAGFWPAILRVGHDRPLQVEDWTLTITECNDAVDDFKFEVEGSSTGPDGSGTNKHKFVSLSGRVVIDPEDWWVTNARGWVGAKMPDHFKIRWTVKLLSRDEWSPPAAPDSSREAATTVAQGLPNQKHTLELTGPSSIQAIRIYRPPVKP